LRASGLREDDLFHDLGLTDDLGFTPFALAS
jgi:hypothetical protein